MGIQFTKIHLIDPFGKEFFRSNENCRQNCLIKWLKVQLRMGKSSTTFQHGLAQVEGLDSVRHL